MNEPDPRVQLGIAGQPLLQAWHVAQDQSDAATVMHVAEDLESERLQPINFIDDENLRAGWLGQPVDVLGGHHLRPIRVALDVALRAMPQAALQLVRVSAGDQRQLEGEGVAQVMNSRYRG